MTDATAATGNLPAPPFATRPVGNRFRASAPGWIAKILLLGLADAIAVAGMITAIDKEAWGYATALAVAFAALNVVYLPRRFIPMKYLLPGLIFLAAFGIYPVLYTRIDGRIVEQAIEPDPFLRVESVDARRLIAEMAGRLGGR